MTPGTTNGNAELARLNSILERVSYRRLPDDIDDRMCRWQRFTEQDWSPQECDQCRRVAPKGYSWFYVPVVAPIIDPPKVSALEESDRRMFVKLGNGYLWLLEQRCAGCADMPRSKPRRFVHRADDADLE